MQEFEGLDHNEIARQENQAEDPVPREEIEEKFEGFIREERGSNPDTSIKRIETDTLFDMTEVNLPDSPPRILRNYWGYHTGEHSTYPFSVNASSQISKEGRLLELSKTGRPSITELRQRSEFERIEFEKTDSGYTLAYAAGNIKGEALKSPGEGDSGDYSVVTVGFSGDGELEYIDPVHRDVDTVRNLGELPVFDTSVGVFSDVESFKEFAKTNGKVRKGDIKLNIRFDEGSSTFEIEMLDKSGNPEYKLVVPEKVDISTIMSEFGAEQLLRDPYQPSAGVPGQSIGDQDWRYKSFPDLIGVKIFPV